jgi:hypothetical protein
MMSINNSPASYEIVGETNEATNLVITIDGINTLSVILEYIGGSFDNEIYSIYISNDGEDWIKIYDLSLRYNVATTNSFPYNNAMNGILFLRFERFSVQRLENRRSKITVSAR